MKAEIRGSEGVPYVRQLSRRELREVVAHVEDVILKGTAQIGDYEDFVLCKQELVRRERPETEQSGAEKPGREAGEARPRAAQKL